MLINGDGILHELAQGLSIIRVDWTTMAVECVRNL